MEDQNIILPNSAIIEFITPRHEISSQHKIAIVSDLYDWLRQQLNQPKSIQNDWFGEGIDCMLLDFAQASKDWMVGKISIQFIFSCHQSDSQEELIGSSPSNQISIDKECMFHIPVESMGLEQERAVNILLGMSKKIFTPEELTTHLRQLLSLADINSYRYAWIDYGVPCRVSFPGLSDGWNKGRVYLGIRYQSDEIQDSEDKLRSSLDEIRNAIEAS